MTGRYADEIPDEDVKRYVTRFYIKSLNVRMPIYENSERVHAERVFEHEALSMPLSSDGEDIDILMVYRTTGKFSRRLRLEEQYSGSIYLPEQQKEIRAD